MKIYTRTGDDGTTGLIGGSRATKGSLRICVIGDLDEANAAIGMAAASLSEPSEEPTLATILDLLHLCQVRLFEIGSELAAPPEGKIKYELLPADADGVLEESIDQLNEVVTPLTNFILPGGGPEGSALHFARTIVRRAERSIAALDEVEPIRSDIKKYVNRLSDWLFMAARSVNRLTGAEETVWKPGSES